MNFGDITIEQTRDFLPHPSLEAVCNRSMEIAP